MFMGQKYIYVGKNNEFHKNGETYSIIETGEHWIKAFGYVIWMTTAEYPNTNDIDYGLSVDVSYFKSNFWR